jgi:hypothetical protein
LIHSSTISVGTPLFNTPISSFVAAVYHLEILNTHTEMYVLALGLFVSLLNPFGVSGQLKQCTSQQTAAKGQFKCLDGCDEDHKVGGTKKYCLSYFPDGGNCYLKPYTRNDVLTCNGKVTASTAPMWLVLVGGSNQFMMLKVLLDVLLNLPSTAGYNPTAYYGAHRKYL